MSEARRVENVEQAVDRASGRRLRRGRAIMGCGNLGRVIHRRSVLSTPLRDLSTAEGMLIHRLGRAKPAPAGRINAVPMRENAMSKS